ncbi:hypothetical protein MPTA5024_02280 [Microbispora sp. ATCC PTA-5024]|nr:hypothetical protein MPTA5024_02280 [Microbispora sp. ATCC PTA-5024]
MRRRRLVIARAVRFAVGLTSGLVIVMQTR